MRATVIAAAALLLAAGCSGDPAPPRRVPVAVAPSAADTPLTPRSAAVGFRTWALNDDLARASGDTLLAQSWADDSQQAVAVAEFRERKADGRPVPRHVYGEPVLWVPRLAGYPQWFVASVKRQDKPVLMAFIRKNPKERFRLSVVVTPGKGMKVPKVPVDKDGYAQAVAPDAETGLLTSPGTVASLQAAVADEGPRSFSARVVKEGPYTTGLFTAHQKAAKAAAKHGLTVTSTFTVPVQPLFALRTSDGSALVLYPLTRDTATVHTDAADPEPVPVPEAYAHLVPHGLEASRLHVFSSLQFAAVVPAHAQGKERPKAVVIASGGGVTRIKSA
ncbi:hypothetical protein LO762_18855 [Actinocorallia sp. API 0066]|uniref:hypothetical protein n=1 Tax=Actinocorallia sp. API 0066 TaxID=2896846 RepID=UPI001E3F75AF|nr:hypothetical protein [Actinocorallia sp. API 0066]MCD0451242.1 hypothetical protein [Actinocorallia sp. API 0066]